MQKKGNKNTEPDAFIIFVKSKLDSHRLEVDENCWNEIDKRLNERRRKKISLWAWISATAVAAASIILLIITPMPSYHEGAVNDMLVEAMENDPYEKNSGKIETDQAQPAEKELAAVQHRRPASPEPDKNLEIVRRKADADTEMPETSVPEQEAEDSIEKEIPPYVDKNKAGKNKQSEKEYNPYSLEENSTKGWTAKKKKKQNSWLASAAISSGGRPVSSSRDLFPLGTNNYSRYLEPPQGSCAAPEGKTEADDAASSIQAPNYIKAAASTDYSDVTHLPPLSFGVSIRKDLNKHLAVESGLIYTYLSSKYENKGLIRRDAVLSLHYLGIPANAVVYFLNNTRLSIYLSAGGMVEKGLLSVYSENIYQNDKTKHNTTKDNITGLQWSLNASIGLSWTIYNDVSIYFEPGISYYLNNNQPLSARTENPFIAGFNAGVRCRFN